MYLYFQDLSDRFCLKNLCNHCGFTEYMRVEARRKLLKSYTFFNEVLFCYLSMGSLLADDLEFVSLLKPKVTIMVGFITVYGHHKVVCKRNVVNLI